MNIAVMLRTLEEKQGIGIYARNLMSAILNIDRQSRYYFIYANKNQLGTFGNHENLEETVIDCKNKFVWDQIEVPKYAKQKNADLIFNTKFSVPLWTKCKTIMVFHGSEWFIYPEFYSKLDIIYNRLFLPMYSKKATAISCVSKMTADDMIKYLRIDPKKMFIVHSAIDPRFKSYKDMKKPEEVKKKYNLPDRYILFVGKIYPGKNFRNIIKSFSKLKNEVDFPLKLVSVGDLRWKYETDFKEIEDLGLTDDILFTGWVEQEDLPSIYQKADLFLFPSLYEGFGIPILEAMACKCPVVTADTGACPEVGGSAPVYVDPKNVESITEGTLKVIQNTDIRKTMIKNGIKEIQRFGWEKSASRTVEIFNYVMKNGA